MTTTLEQLLNPIADALQLDMEFKGGFLYGEQELEGVIDNQLIPGIPILGQFRIVDSVVDDYYGVMGVIAKVGGSLYLALINDDRAMKLTLFVVDGKKANINQKIQKNGRLGSLDRLDGHWSRKKFYSVIAPGVKATFTRSSVENDWELESVGPGPAMKYLAKRKKEDQSPNSKLAEVWNKDFDEQRQLSLPKKL